LLEKIPKSALNNPGKEDNFVFIRSKKQQFQVDVNSAVLPEREAVKSWNSVCPSKRAISKDYITQTGQFPVKSL
jgi:hypothetical protein